MGHVRYALQSIKRKKEKLSCILIFPFLNYAALLHFLHSYQT